MSFFVSKKEIIKKKKSVVLVIIIIVPKDCKIRSNTYNTPIPETYEAGNEPKKKGRTRRNEGKKNYTEMKHQAENKKTQKRSFSLICLNASSHPNPTPHPNASSLPPQKWPTPQSTQNLQRNAPEKKGWRLCAL